MNLDKQRIAAVTTLEALGYTWEGTGWKPPATAQTAQLRETDLDLLRSTICRHLGFSYESTIALIAEIKSWGWFKC